VKGAGFEVFHGGEYEDNRILGRSAMCFGTHAQIFLRLQGGRVLFYSEYGCSRLLRNVCIFTPDYTLLISSKDGRLIFFTAFLLSVLPASVLR
jgi:hypothetical protein